ncbi:hypothetical protein LJC16_00490 [Bacteroidales bacterium OttesenSCG-928-C19]|nr:hypothetical protein [Bacteroidales bacterium OttesenSCG-928-C19]
MKSIMITYNQAHSEAVQDILDSNNVRGYTKWEDVHGRGHYSGEPHLGNHAWPAKNMVTMAVVEDEKVSIIMQKLRDLDEAKKQIGLRAFVWNIEEML